ncbi:MAG: T9SS type A sorting domain-containing protein [Rhodothermales bacterium]
MDPPHAGEVAIHELPSAGAVSAGVFDIRGRKVATLFDGMQQAGHRELQWNPSSNASDGVYFVHLDYENKSVTKKVVLQR